MRTAAETLQERAPEELTIDNIERELIQNLHMQQENAASWVTAVRAHFASVSSVPHDVVTAKEIMGLSMGEMHAVCFEAGLTRGDLNNIAIVLGSIPVGGVEEDSQPDVPRSREPRRRREDEGAEGGVKGQCGGAAADAPPFSDKLLPPCTV